MKLSVSGKRVLVTGGSRGIGHQIAIQLAQQGAQVVACHRTDSDAAADLARELKEYGPAHSVFRADVTNPAEISALIEHTRQTLGGLDGLVNNVGIDSMAQLDDLEPEEWSRVIDSNLGSQYLVTRAALPLLAEGASVVNVGASVATRGRPGASHYTASKAGVIGLTRSLAKELGPRGIRVNSVAPGVIETDPDEQLPPPIKERILHMTALKRLGSSAEVSGAVLFLLSDLASYIAGETLTVDGGM